MSERISSDQSMSVPPDTLLHSYNAHNDHGTSFIPMTDNKYSPRPYARPLDAGSSAWSCVGKGGLSSGPDEKGQKGSTTKLLI